MKKIAAVVVTYNRKKLLEKCIEAILCQSYIPSVLYLIDNASKDGTIDMLAEKGYLNTTRNGIKIKSIQLSKNCGGAGGFHAGMKIAHEDGCDAVWMMDDDGLPDQDCLKNLLPHLDQYDYLSPMVIDIQDETMMAFEGCSVAEFMKREKDGVVKGCANPFNGTLFSKRLIDAVGYPKKEMFIWGDEINYNLRSKRKGFIPAMVVNAIHRHPLNRQRYVRYLGRHKMVVPEQGWKLFCLVRNQVYNTKKFKGNVECLKLLFKMLFQYGCYFTIQEFQPCRLLLIANAFYKGYTEDFTGLDKYMMKK